MPESYEEACEAAGIEPSFEGACEAAGIDPAAERAAQEESFRETMPNENVVTLTDDELVALYEILKGRRQTMRNLCFGYRKEGYLARIRMLDRIRRKLPAEPKN
jgi:hypothetical protein